MAAKVSAGGSQFQLQLNPEGLGQVTVTVQIGANRQLSASLSFDSDDTASAISAHSGELKKALEQAGFTLGSGGVTFGTHASPTVAQAQASTPSNPQAGQNANGFSFAGEQGFSNPQGSNGGQTNPFSRGIANAFVSSDDLQATASASAWSRGGGDSRLDIRI
jgi:flagellar hook-length control protein FliK